MLINLDIKSLGNELPLADSVKTFYSNFNISDFKNQSQISKDSQSILFIFLYFL